jgi:uncharacterized protein YndB with AHSA1/START domain
LASIIHQIGIRAQAHDIYELIANKEGLQKWLPEYEGWSITGDDTQGGILTIYYGEYFHKMENLTLNPGKEIKWKCLEGHPDWVGTIVTFTIVKKAELYELHFTHTGWAKKTSWFEMCTALWSGYLANIKNLAEWK